MASHRPAIPRPHRPSLHGRPTRRQDGAGGGAHRPSRAHRVSVVRSRQDLARGQAAARVPQGRRRQRARRRSHVLADAGSSQRARRLVRGTSPQGLFRSEDNGATWRSVAGFNEHPQRKAWCGGDQDGTPDGPKLHSILIDPRDPAHMYIGMSSGGVFESSDGGADWHPLNKGVKADFLPDPDPPYGHDPHCVRVIQRCRIACTSRTTAAFIVWIGRRRVGTTSGRACRRASDRSASQWACTRAIPIPRGCSRWMAPACGRGCRRVASLRHIEQSTAARRGNVSRRACRKRRPGTPSSARRWAPTRALRRRLLRHHQWRGLGKSRRRAQWKCLAAHCRRSMRLSRLEQARLPARRMRVLIPGPLRSYTSDARVVDGRGATLAELVDDLERRFRGFAFRIIDEQGRIRQHIKIFVNRDQARGLDASLRAQR